jgi:hypothetical protein
MHLQTNPMCPQLVQAPDLIPLVLGSKCLGGFLHMLSFPSINLEYWPLAPIRHPNWLAGYTPQKILLMDRYLASDTGCCFESDTYRTKRATASDLLHHIPLKIGPLPLINHLPLQSPPSPDPLCSELGIFLPPFACNSSGVRLSGMEPTYEVVWSQNIGGIAEPLAGSNWDPTPLTCPSS